MPPKGQPRLCTPCRSLQQSRTSDRRPVLPLVLLVAGVGTAAWMGLRLHGLENRLDLLTLRVKALPETVEKPGPFLPSEAEILKTLAKTSPASRSDLEALRAELTKLRGELHLDGPAVLRPIKPIPEAPTVPPVQPEKPPVQATPPAPEKPKEMDLSRDLASEDALTRHQALAMIQIQRADLAPAAVRLLKDEMGFVRRAAAEALGRLQLPETVPALTAAARTEKDLLAKRAVLQALETVTRIPCLAPEGSEADALNRCEAWSQQKKRSTP